MINDILDFSKIEAGKLELDPIEFLLRDSIGDTLRPLAVRARAKGLELACDVDPDVPDALIGDPGRLRQILVNLVGNAIKFTERGEVVICVSSRARAPRDEVVLDFAVTDTGIGIPPAGAARIFEAFKQADDARPPASTAAPAGPGDLHAAGRADGRTDPRWRATHGSRQHLPCSTCASGVAAPGASASPGRRPDAARTVRVLIVDDNATNRRILAAMLVSWRMRPHAGRGWRQIGRWLRCGHPGTPDEPFRLVLTRREMPEMDGFTLAGGDRGCNHIRLATDHDALIGRGQPATRAGCRELGVAAYLHQTDQAVDLHRHRSCWPGRGGRQPLRNGIGPRGRPPVAPPPACRGRICSSRTTPSTRLSPSRLLEKRGEHRHRGRQRARRASKRCGCGAFNGVLMDVQMPEMNGLEATRRLRERERLTGGHPQSSR